MTAQQDDLLLLDEAGLLGVNKPAGYETVAQRGSTGASLCRKLQNDLALEYLEPVHRLDRYTTGAQLYAKDQNTLTAVTDIYRERLVRKCYLGICAGIPENPRGSINRNLSKWHGGHKPVSVVKGDGGHTAHTDYQVLGRNTDFPASLIMFMPHEGRTHQIRVHAQSCGWPILGDDQYGLREANKQLNEFSGLSRQALHSWKILLPPLAEHSKPVSLEAPVTDEMNAALTLLFPNWFDLLGL